MPTETKSSAVSDVEVHASDMKTKKVSSPVHGQTAGMVKVALLDGSVLDVSIDVSKIDNCWKIFK